jgi:2-dehydropantoate 2-reductase
MSPGVTARATPVAEVLGNSGTVEVVDDIVAAKWMKLIVNAGELVPSAILGLSLYEASRVPGMRDFMLHASLEALAAAESIGVRPTPTFGQPINDTKDMGTYVEKLTAMVVETFGLPHSRTTVLQTGAKGVGAKSMTSTASWCPFWSRRAGPHRPLPWSCHWVTASSRVC